MAPKISLAMIAKNEEENLGQALSSVAGHVDEIIVVDTGSTDRTREIAVQFGSNVYQWDHRNHPEGFFLDDEATCQKFGAPPPYSGEMAFAAFGEARNESFRHATGDYIMWLDADDVVERPDQIRTVVAEMEKAGHQFAFLAYDYARDHLGRVFYRQWRERIIKRGTGSWINPVHEVILPTAPVSMGRYEHVLISHRRKADRKSIPNRNYKILLHHLHQEQVKNPGAPVDPRTLFYLGQEARFIEPMKAMGFYSEYLKTSGWGEERASAHVALGHLSEFGQNQLPEQEAYAQANLHYAAAAVEMPDNPDGLLGLARVAYLRGRYQDCVNYTDRAFAIGNTDSMLGANPMDRLYRPHAYYNHALAKLGRLEDAIASCKAALAVMPDDPGVPGGASGMITLNLKCYEDQLAMTKQVQPDEGLKPVALLNKNEDLESPPSPNIPTDAMVIWGMQLWKQAMAAGDPTRAHAILDGLPPQVALDPVVAKMRQVTDRRFPDPSRPIDITWEGSVMGTGIMQYEYRQSHSVVFWLGPCFEPWDPTSPNRVGLGGSETAAIEMAKHFRALGWEATVYAEADGEWDGVRYVKWDKFQGCKADVFVASRAPAIADWSHSIEAPIRLLWVHDIHVGSTPDPAQMQGWLSWFTRILCLSQWHRTYFLSSYPFVSPEQVVVTRNGIDPARFANDGSHMNRPGLKVSTQAFYEKRNDLIFSSSPNRGLDNLLPMFQHIRKEVPDAHLHIMYGFDCWETLARQRNDAAEMATIQRYKDMIQAGVRQGGVTWHGRMNQKDLAAHFMRAKVWAYPTQFPETSCISAMEAMAAGCVPVTSRFAALAETVKHGILIDPGPGYGNQWIAATLNMLKDDSKRVPIAQEARRYALENLSWAGVAKDWVALFDQLGGAEASPIPLWRSA